MLCSSCLNTTSELPVKDDEKIFAFYSLETIIFAHFLTAHKQPTIYLLFHSSHYLIHSREFWYVCCGVLNNLLGALELIFYYFDGTLWKMELKITLLNQQDIILEVFLLHYVSTLIGCLHFLNDAYAFFHLILFLFLLLSSSITHNMGMWKMLNCIVELSCDCVFILYGNSLLSSVSVHR